MDTTANSVHLPLLSAELPAGWRVSESATFVAPSGQAIWVTVDRVDDAMDTDALIEHHLTELRGEFGEPSETSTSTGTWRGATAIRTCTIRFDDPRHVRVVAGVVDHGLALRVTGAWPINGEDGTDDVGTVAGGIRLLSRPAYETARDVDVPVPTPREARPEVAAPVWARLNSTWSSIGREGIAPAGQTVWSPDELATIATVLGVPSFPTVGPDLLAALTDSELHAVLGATMRSLTARGVVEITSNGSVVLNDDILATMEVALFPDLAISIESGGAASSPVGTYLGIRPDDAVRIDVTPSGTRVCSNVAPSAIVEVLMSLVGAPEDVEEAVDAVGRQTMQLRGDELSERWGAMESTWQISSTWREGSLVSGRVLHTAMDADGDHWIAEPDDEIWTLGPATPDELRCEILGCLPGSA